MEISNLTKNIFDSAPWGIHLYKVNEKGDLIFSGTNPAADKILNLDNSQFMGKTIEEAFPYWKGKDIPKIYKEVADTGKSWSGEQISYNQGNIVGVFDVHAFRVFPGWVAVAFEDVTNTEKLKNKVKEEQKKYQILFELSPDPVAVVDLDGKFILVNEQCFKTFGFKRSEDMVGLSIMSFVAPEYLEKVGEAFNKIKEVGYVYQFQFNTIDNTKTITKKVELSATLVRNEQNKPLYVIGSLKDITHTKRLEEETHEKIFELERLNKLMVGREMKMIELKKENEDLKSQINKLLEEVVKK